MDRDRGFAIDRRVRDRLRAVAARTSPMTSDFIELFTASFSSSSSSTTSGPTKYHVKVSPQCSICVDRILDGENALALVGENHLYKGVTWPFPLPSRDSSYRLSDEYLFCRTKRCACDPSIEYSTVHLECYQIFLRVCDLEKIQKEPALQKLWIFAAWRLPWQNALSMPASNVDIPTNPKSLQSMGQLFGITFLHRLPLELLLAVWRESKDSLFWRCMSIIRMVVEFEINTSELQVKPLDQVVSWDRNGGLECAPASAMYPITRLTIDQEGIKKVERLRCRPLYAGEVHSLSTFIVEEGSSLRGIEAQFQDGRLRLRTTQIQRNYPYIWNTPAPPRFSLCKGQMPESLCSERIQVVNTQKIVGITFFFLGDQLYDVYIHDSDKSSANTLFEQLSPNLRASALWMYLPIGAADRMLVFGTRLLCVSKYNILVRMEKAGDIVIGRNCFFSADDFHYLWPEGCPSSRPDQCLSGDGPVTLLYGETTQGFPSIPLLGAYCASGTWTLPEPFKLEKATPEPLIFSGYQSRAPLGQIAESTVYYRPDTGCCRGILLRYKNGGCRAVGQCRVNVDPSEAAAEPSLICVRKERCQNGQGHTEEKTLVKFTHGTLDDGKDEGWMRYPLEGFVDFYFFIERVLVTIVTEFKEDVVRPMECSKGPLDHMDMAYKRVD